MIIIYCNLMLISGHCEQIKDISGTTIKLPFYPKRIVSLAPSITECLFAIGAGDRVVGVTQFSNYPQEVKRLPKVGSYIYPSIEKILSLKPDLILATKDGNPRHIVLKLRNIGIKVFVVDPRDIHSLFSTMLVLGKLVGCEKKAKSTVDRLRKEVDSITQKGKLFKYPPKVFFQIGIDPMVTVGRNTLIDNLIKIAGGKNIFGSFHGYPRISVEQVIGLNPDIIIITSMVHSASNLNRLKSLWEKYKEIDAVKYSNVFVVNSDFFNRPAPRAIKGLKLLSMIFEKAVNKISN
ncbi:ABC transporter substrate-binding protein [Desulfothermus okinawensis JCM 13304]